MNLDFARLQQPAAPFDYSKKAAYVVIATQALVDWLLSLNTHNRPIRATAVAILKNSLRRDEWFLTNQGIGVTASGWLSDGQHRLQAIKDSGYPPVEILLVLGLDERAQAVTDTHAKRSQSDVIRLVLNKTVSNQAVAAVNIVFNVKSLGDKFTVSKKAHTDFQIAEFITEHNELLSRLLPAIGSSGRAAVAAALIDYAMKFDVDSACSLAEQIRTGLELSSTSPAYRLRNWLSKNKGGGSGTQADAYGATVTACIAHAMGESLSLIRASGSWDRLPKQKTQLLQAA